MSKMEPWDVWILEFLLDGKPGHLKGIYADIEQHIREGHIDSRYAKFDRSEPKYTHRVRSYMKGLVERGRVEHLGKGRTGRYQITDAGKKWLLD